MLYHRTSMRIAVRVLTAAVVLWSNAVIRPANAAAVRVLFIGNSLTEANDLPAMVESLGKANGERIEPVTLAFPNYSLEDHWNRGDAQRAIARGGWAFVVLQQGPSALPESRVLLVEYAQRFAAEAKRVGARTALYMVWPSANRRADFDAVRVFKSGRGASGRWRFPARAGEAWRAAWRSRPELALYGPDGFHPTRLGSRLPALVIHEGLMGKPAIRGGEEQVLRGTASQALRERSR